MSDAHAASQSSWRQLDDEWHSTRNGWKDGTAEYFETHFWMPLESEMKTYEHTFARLIETLRAAQSIASE